MVAKAFLILCGSVLLVKSISAQCTGYGGGVGWGNNLALAEVAGAELAGARLAGAGYGAGVGWPNNLAGAELAGARLAGAGYGYGASAPFNPYVPAAFGPTNGGSFTVTSSSPITPTGITIFSENTIEGPMEVAGELPILATVAIEGQFPSQGAVATTYGCGNGQVGISSESLAAAGLGAGNLARAELVGAGFAGNLARAELGGAGFAGNLARAELAGAGLARAQIANAGLAGNWARAELANAGLKQSCAY